MRRPRDSSTSLRSAFDAELKALNDRAKLLKERKLYQLGELVLATGGDALPIDVLAGAMLMAVETNDAATLEVWCDRGRAFFQSTSRSAARRTRGDARGAPADNSGAQPATSDASAQ